MNLLAIETATERCSVALISHGRLYTQTSDGVRKHAELLLPLVDGLLSQAGVAKSQLTAIAFGCGPGAFTGVRLACSVVQGLAFALDCPTVAVSTLAALAQMGLDSGASAPVLALLDARMGEVYAGFYGADRQGLAVSLYPEQLSAPDLLTLPGDDVWSVLGSGWTAQLSALSARLGARVHPHPQVCMPDAAAIARIAMRDLKLGLGTPAERAQPVYLRDKVAKTVLERAATAHARAHAG